MPLGQLCPYNTIAYYFENSFSQLAKRICYFGLMFTIIDIETTGGNSKSDKITEIAIFKHDGKQIVESFTSLINPEKRIPFYITELTGINDEMVENAPKFYEVAKKIIELTENAVFVAHNVGFDFNFIRAEFKSLGYDFSRPKLCTVKLSRLLFPGQPSYSLGKLCKALDISINHRHRAEGDASATVKLFEMLIEKDQFNVIENGGKARQLPAHLNSNLSPELLKDIPNETGVYHFYNEFNELIYIGKSKNIKSRINAHLNNFDNQKAIEMRNEIATIEYTLTGSELVSMLLESSLIKKHKPFFNRKQLKAGNNFGLYSEYLIDGFIHFKSGKINKRSRPLAVFSTQNQAKGYLNHLVSEFDLCPKLTGLDYSSGPCMQQLMGHCEGNCYLPEKQDDYNQKAKMALSSLVYPDNSFIIIDKGRTTSEKSIVIVENGRYKGYGYVNENEMNEDPKLMKLHITKDNDSMEVQQIIKTYLKKHEELMVITY